MKMLAIGFLIVVFLAAGELAFACGGCCGGKVPSGTSEDVDAAK